MKLNIVIYCVFFMLALAILKNNNLQGELTSSSNELGKSFGELADAYVDGRKPSGAAVYERLNFLGSDIVVLDLGCGTGISTKPLCTHFNEVYGCDADERMLQKFTQDSDLRHVQVVQGIAEHLPFKDNTFGLVTMFSSFHWFCNDEAVEEITRVLNKNGYVYVVHGSRCPYSEEAKEIFEKIIGQKIPDAKNGFNPSSILMSHGFNVILDERISVEETYTIDEAVKRCQSWSSWNYVKQCGPEAERTAEEAIRKLYSSLAEDGTIKHVAGRRVLLVQKQ